MKRERNLKLKDGKWYIDLTFRGKRIRQFGGFTKEQARNNLARLRIDKLNERMGFKKPGNGEPVPFEKFADEFLELYCKQNKRSWDRDALSLKTLKTFFKGKNLQDIGPEAVERFKAKRRTEVSDSTVNREVACLKTLFNKAVEWGRIENNPILKVKKLREPNSKERILSRSEAARLFEALGPQVKPVIRLALNTGMRRTEILSLRWKDIDFQKGFIHVGDSKSGRSRNVPINSQAFEALKSLPQKTEFVFYNAETRDHIKDVKTGFKAACRRAGINGLRFHDLRHTAATWMVEAGVDLVTVSKILGHASIQMTMRYAHPTPENMRRAVDRLSDILDPTRQKLDSIPLPGPKVSPVLMN